MPTKRPKAEIYAVIERNNRDAAARRDASLIALPKKYKST